MKLTKRSNGNKVAPTLRSILDDFWGTDDFFERRWVHAPLLKTPAVNIKNFDENFEISMAAPGLNRDDFEVTIENNILSIMCEKEEKEENYTREEFNYTAFSRAFSLPENADSESVDAKYRDGVLTLTLKKTEVSEPASKTIDIK